MKIQLVGGSSPNEGRIEMSHSKYGKGSVCESQFDIKDGSVVCKMLGYGAAREVPKRAYFGEGKRRVLMTNVDCSGLEFNIADCHHSGWKQGTCPKYSKDASVICFESTYCDSYFFFCISVIGISVYNSLL